MWIFCNHSTGSGRFQKMTTNSSYFNMPCPYLWDVTLWLPSSRDVSISSIFESVMALWFASVDLQWQGHDGSSKPRSQRSWQPLYLVLCCPETVMGTRLSQPAGEAIWMRTEIRQPTADTKHPTWIWDWAIRWLQASECCQARPVNTLPRCIQPKLLSWLCTR